MPVPLKPDVIVMKALLLTAVQEQLVPVMTVTVTSPVPVPEPNDALLGVIENVQDAAGSSVATSLPP